jgi:hypothetical protein
MWAQEVAKPATTATTTTKPTQTSGATVAAAPATMTKEDVVQLSPFVVNTTKDAGYFAENTLAGSRINTNLGDLAASITVVTRQQMEDTASVDINDIFKYEANTEGSSTYQPSVVDRNTVKDTIAGYSFGNDGTTATNAQSNRIRGLNAPDAAINNYSTNNRIPLDEYNTQSIEISRGPNSMLFGLATPSGVVNMNTTQAALNRNTNTVTVRTDDRGSYRSSFSINRSLISGKLAVFGAFLYDNRQFERKPSRDLYRRQFGAITYKPFKNTTIRAFAENYQNDANRPNTFTPRDEVTSWLQAGRPQYDPTTRMVTIPGTVSIPANTFITPQVLTGNGQILGPYVSDTRSPGYVSTVNRILGANAMTTFTSPLYVPGIAALNTTQVLRRIDYGNTVDFFQRSMPGFYAPAQTNPATAVPSASSLGWTAAASGALFLKADELYTGSGLWPQPIPTINGSLYTPVNGVSTINAFGSYNFPGVTNKSIYDWTKYNTIQTNWARVRASNYNVEFEQQISSKLFFSAGWLRQDIEEVDNYTINQLQGATLAVDTNLKNMDGTTNPYFGLPYIMEGQGGGVDTFYNPQTDDNFRAMLMFDQDFTQNRNWTKWLGRHRLIGTWQEQDSLTSVERWRNNYVGGDTDATLRFTRNLTLSAQALWSNSTLYRNFYMASPGDPSAAVTHSIGFYGNQGWQGPVGTNVQVWNYRNNSFEYHNLIEQTEFADNGSKRSQREVKGSSFAIQSYLWKDRLIATLGARHDDFRARVTTSGQITDINGNIIQPAMTTAELYTNGFTGEINHDAVMKRYGIWQKYGGSTKTIGLALRPFRDWQAIENLGGGNPRVSQFLSGLTFYFNQSNNFNPPAQYQTDYFFKPLAKPTGKTKEEGIGFNLFNNKLVARINWYETQNLDERTSAAGTLLTRAAYSDTTTGYAWASTVERLRLELAAGYNLNGTSDPRSIFAALGSSATTGWNTDTGVLTATGVNMASTAVQQRIYTTMQLPYLYYSGLNLGATQQSKSKGTEVQITFNPSPSWTIKFTGSKNQATYTKVAPEYDEWIAARMPIWTTNTAADMPATPFIDPNNNRAYSLRNFWTGYGFTNVAYAENTDGNTSPRGYFDNVVASQVATAKALEGAVSPFQRIYHAALLTNYSFSKGSFKGLSVGGTERWESRAAIGYIGKVGNTLAPNIISVADITQPVYGDNGNYYTDLWVGYTFKILDGKVITSIRLNCNNALESGRLVATQCNFDGTPWAYRIIDPRQWILSAKFTF